MRGFDFTRIHPFNDGNGRMSRLLTLLLLYRSGYTVGKYVSIERIIEQSKETYYEALAASTQGWDDQTNDYAPFVNYLFGVILKACKEFDERVETLTTRQASDDPQRPDSRTGRNGEGHSPIGRRKTKEERVAAILADSLTPLSKADIIRRMPDVSVSTVERALKSLLDANTIIKIGSGRATRYIMRR